MTFPALFFGHGNPMNAIGQNAYTEAWAEIGRSVPKPKAILCVSAHWYIPAVAVTAMETPRTIHDFGGFPHELFEFQYPAKGSPELAGGVKEIVGEDVHLDERKWGLDHGTWSVLAHVFPDADIPVVQLSINEIEPPAFHYELGRKLAPLRDEGILIIGSGNIVHNLHTYAWGKQDAEPFDWAGRFDETIRNLLVTGDHEPVVNYETLGRDALLSVPTPDHYLPLLYIAALAEKDDEISFPAGGYDGGSISMTAVRIG
jgi:4,5-DOPA dioxygenase extradiol